MGKLWATPLVVAVLVGCASPVSAQSASEVLLPSHSLPVESLWQLPATWPLGLPDAEQRAELQRWMEAFADWQEWWSRWRGRREPGWLAAFRDRRPKPPPPPWLPAYCAAVSDDLDPLMPACALFSAWRSDDSDPPLSQTATVLGSSQEQAPRTVWWEHLHMDLMWPALQWQSSSYGVVGLHHSTTVKGRLQVFTAPGVLLLNLPSANGFRTWQAAVNYGMGFRVFDFSLLGRRPAELHFNLAKTWIVSNASDLVVGRSLDVAGFSVTFKKVK